MDAVEEKYWAHVTSLSGKERIARSLALFDDVSEMIALRITQKQPDLTGRELNRRIALQLYRSDSMTQSLLGGL